MGFESPRRDLPTPGLRPSGLEAIDSGLNKNRPWDGFAQPKLWLFLVYVCVSSCSFLFGGEGGEETLEGPSNYLLRM